MSVADEAWVTVAVNEKAATKALVLAKSLKRVLTSRKVVVVISDGLSAKIRSHLQEEFDSVFPYNSDGLNGTGKDLSAKISCWNLPIFRKCVFLDPNSFILRNCDELFETNEEFHAPLDGQGGVDSSIFVFTPAPKTYNNLMTLLENANGTVKRDGSEIINGYFGQWMRNSAISNSFNTKFNQKLSIKNGKLATDQTNLAIVYFVGDHPLDLLQSQVDEQMGIVEQSIFRLWEEIYKKQVEPVLNLKEHEPEVDHCNNVQSPTSFSSSFSDNNDPRDIPNEPIAIVGMGCRYPGAKNIPEFWQLLVEGRDAIIQVTPDRWTKEQGCVMTPDTKTSQAGFLTVPVDEFDGKFFGISPMEMSFLDPQQRFLLEVIWESLEDANIAASSLKDAYAGVFIGEWTNDYKELLREQGNKEFYRTYMGNSPGSAAGRISFILGLTGPSVATESGCSSAMVAVDLACKSLRLGESKLAIAAGVNLLLHPFSTKDMSMVCAPDGHCKTFDESADGFGRAEGCGSLILKRYSDAVNDGDKIWALIRGTGVAQEGPSRSLGTPTVHCEAMAMKRALVNAGVRPNQVSYVETHGTGTPVGDPMEVAAIAQVYAEGREEPLTIGSVKTNVGHTESCSGITGIMKVVLSLQNEIIPPHRNFEKLNPNVKLEAVPAELPLEPKKWERTQKSVRFAGVSSFGITGTDAHAIIQESPDVDSPALILGLNRPQHIMTISTKSESAMDELLKTYEKFLAEGSIDLADAAYSTNIGRAHFQHRVAITGKTTQDIVTKLEKNAYDRQQIPENQPKTCFLFTGQGSQYPGMAKSLYDTSPVFRMHFDNCESLLREKYSVEIKAALWGDKNNNISRTIYSQTSIFCVEYCLTKLWESYGVKPDCVVGHSLGEFAAACAAGILKLEDAMELVAQRSRLIDSLPGGKMMAIKSSPKAVDSLLEQFVKINPDKPLDYAAVNSAEQVVLAGSQDAIEGFALMCKNNNFKTHVLEATHAFHSRFMDPMLPEYRTVANKMNYANPNCTFISGMDGKIMEDGEITPEYWVRHTRESVKFLQASNVAYQEGCRMFLEVGPQPVLSALTMMNCSDHGEPISCLPSLRKNEEEWTTLLNTLGKLYVNGFDIDWHKYDQYFSRKKVTLPSYPFQRKTYWFECKANMGGMINGTEVHPLIGCAVPNASSVKMYQTCMDLKKETYIKDHCIGSKIIFPGAGYMEMTLAAGHATTQGCTEILPDPGTPLTVENLVIEAPLCVSETEACDIQLLVSSEDMTSAGYKISIHRRIDNKWLKHAHGEFSPFAIAYEDSKEQFAEIQERCQETVNLSEFYDKLSDIGLKFGETFKSLKTLWRGDKELVAEINVPENANEYLCHPVVIDAMIQALMLSRNQKVEKLIVPITIKKFIWLAKSESKSYFVHCKPETQEGLSGVQAVLYDDLGKKLALMSGAELIETTVEVILSALEQQKLSLPNLYEDAWRSTAGPLMNRITAPDCHLTELVYKDLSGEEVEYSSFWDPYTNKKYEELPDQLSYLYILQAFYELGWEPEIGNQFDLKFFISQHHILETHTKLIRHFLNTIFVDEKILQQNGDDSWEVINIPPSSEDIATEVFKIRSELEVLKLKDMPMVAAIGEVYSKILSGKESALSILFPEDPTKMSAEVFYIESEGLKPAHQISADVLKNMLHKIQTSSEGKGVIRFLEVGGGTGSTTRALLPIIEESKVRYEYTFTDISKTFFTRAAKNFETYEKNMKYRLFNVEDDPKEQGFIPHYYDMIIAANVIHATKDLSISVRNLRHLLRNEGGMLLVETNKPVRHVDLVFGVLEGYWIYTDTNLRPHHAIINGSEWAKLFNQCDFNQATAIPCYFGQQTVVMAKASATTPEYFPPTVNDEQKKMWISFSNGCRHSRFIESKLRQVGKNVVVVNQASEYKKTDDEEYGICSYEKPEMEKLLSELQKPEGTQIQGILYLWGLDQRQSNQKYISQGFLNLSQIILTTKFKAYPRIYVVTGGIMPVSETEPSNPSAGTLWGLTRSLRSEQPNLTCRGIDISLDDDSNDMFEELFFEIWNEDGENQVVYRERQRYVGRFVTAKLSFTDLPIPNSSRFALTLPSTRTIADLKFDVLGKGPLEKNEIEVKVKAAGLNFKDVLNVLKPDAQFDNSNSVGADFAGIVSAIGPDVTHVQIGDYVVGCNFQSVALPSHINTYDDAVVPLPARLTFAEGATLPAVFATAFYCLVTIGELKRGETILIHTASGGVGICAIQIADWIGANVIATAGSKRKRTFLRSMGVKHVFHSRNLSFGADIEKATDGHGVQMVLNSLTSPGFKEASLKSCCPGARFVEMSKLNIWKPEEVEELRADVQYTIVDLTAVSQETWKMLFAHLKAFLEQEKFKPIPYVRFNGINIREALTYLQKAKHVGKVVCIMPEIEMQNGEYIAKTPMFNDRSTYIITGGLGGIGVEVAKWMASSGAQNIVMVGRSAPGEVASQAIETMKSQGRNIIVQHIDVGSFDQCKAMIETLRSAEMGLPPIRGVMHAAGCLSDAIIVNQTWEKFEKTFNAKVNGGMNLHRLTLDFPMEHFVMFSSVVALIGPLGQSNHAAGNTFLDALAHHRIACGLPAVTVNWGQWGQVGVAAGLEVAGLIPFSPAQGIAALEAVMKSQRPQISVLEADLAAIRKLFPQTKRYVEELKLLADSGVQIKISSETFWKEYDAAEEGDKTNIVQGYLENILRQILKLDKNDVIDENQNLQEMGLDSLMMVEMKNFLQTLMGSRVTVSASSLQDCHNVMQLTGRLIDLIEGSGEDATFVPLTKEELNALIKEDSTLPDHIKPTNIPACKPSEVRKVLLTGVTGNLAPYILRSISGVKNLEKIFCLVRPSNKTSGMDRILNNLKEKNLLSQIQVDKIESIEGNLGEQFFGLSEEAYTKLTEEVDGIIHCAVKSNHIEPYRKSERNKRDVRSINVGGTVKILEFATTGKTKLILHASTMVAVTKPDEKGQLPEEFPGPDDFNDLPNVGYAISKFISDRLMAEAVDRGVQCKCLRFPGIAGDSQTGQHGLQDNHMMLRTLSYMKMGMMPTLPLPWQILPVDICADAAGQLFFIDDSPIGIYNVTNPTCDLEHEFVEVAKEFGHTVKLVEYTDFKNRLGEEDETSLLFPLKDLYFNEETFMALCSSPGLIQAWLRSPNKVEFFTSKRLSQFIPEVVARMDRAPVTMKRDLLFAKKAGIFEKFGLEEQKQKS